MSANFVQVSGPGGRVQSLTPGTGTQTFIFNPSSLKGTTPGGDLIYASRARVRVTGALTRTTAAAKNTPNWEQMAQALGQCRVYSQFLGEMVNKSLTSVPLLANHDMFFVNGHRANTRTTPTQAGSLTTDVRNVEYRFEIPFERDYLVRSTDTCPWLPFLEGGIIEIDLAPSNALALYGWTMSGTWTCEVVIDWYPDGQALIHAPVQSRLYRVTTSGPEYLLKGVGSANGLDGVVMGSRLALLSWLGQGVTAAANTTAHDSGFYAAFAGGGILFGTAGVTRLDVPFRDQVSIDAVTAWIDAFLADSNPVRFKANTVVGTNVTADGDTDLSQWPYAMDPNVATSSFLGTSSLVNDALNFWPLIWPAAGGSKIADMQKVDGDLSFTATLTTPPANPVLHLFRTDEICGFTGAKVMDLMDRMGMPHKQRGGAYDFVPKYAGAKRADDTTQWGMPLKIVRA